LSQKIIGIVALDGAQTPSPITSILGELMDEGDFSKFLAVITLTAAMAAIMSTADSLVIAISQLITVEVAYPL
jgi:Na+(H+)/acetate symporter ActP